MKKIYLLVLFVFGFTAFAQQKGISYQAVIINPKAVAAPGYNGSSIPLANKSICLSFQIVNGVNQLEYQESQSITTDGYGMINVVIGTGTSGTGLVSTLEAVTWNQGNKKLVVGVNTDGVCSNYTEISNQVLNFTPYSFYAQNADIKDGYVTTAKLADGAVTDSKVAMGINPTKVGLGNVNNTSDSNKPVSTAAQTALNLKANATDVTTSLGLKEDLSNKSSDIATDASPTINYPTVKAVKDYVDANSNTGTIVDADTATKGKIKLAGDLAGTADLPTVPGLALKANAADVTTSLALKEEVSNKSTTTTLGNSDVLFPTQNAVKTYVDSQVTSATIADADATTKGKIQLAGDLGGTAAVPVIANNAVITSKIADASVTDVKIVGVSGSKVIGNISGSADNVTGIIPVSNGGTGATTLTGLVKGNGTSALTAAVSGTDYQEPITLTTTGSGAATLTGNTLNIPSTTNYTLPTSSASVLGGVKVGTNLSIDGNGILSSASSPTYTGTVTAPIYASLPQALTAGATITWNPANGLNASVTLDQNSTLSFTATPTAGSYGTLVVSQDATGGRTLTLPSTTNKVLGSTSTTTVALSSAANAKDILNFYYDGTNCYWNIGQGYGTAATAAITNLATSVSGTLPVANGGTGAATLTGLVKGNGTGAMTAATAGTDYLAPTGSAANLTNFPTLNQNTTGNAATATTATSATNVTGTVAVANGGTGATTAGAALTALGAQASANLSTDMDNDRASITKYPAVKTVKDYVDATVISGAPDASTTVKGKIQLAGDLAGTATSPSVVKLRGTPISSVAPTTAGHVLTYDVSGNATWAAPANSANTISGVVPVANGGTGLSSVTSGGAVYATSSNALATGTLPITAGGTGAISQQAAINALTGTQSAGKYLRSDGTNAALSAIQAADVTGTLGVANGGTGLATLTANNVLLGNGTSALQAVAPGTSGNVLTSNGTTWTSTAPAASGVPYTGATGPVDLGAYNLTVSSFTIGQGKTPASGDNLAIGRSALNNTTANGYPNIGLGSNSLNQTTNGKYNIGLGFNALYANTTGSNNIGIGNEAGRNASTWSNITAVGMEALKYESGAGNTAIGSYAGKPSTNAVYTGTTNSTFIGYNTSTGKSAEQTITNATAIGYGATVTASDKIQLGNTSVTNVATSGTVTAGAVTYPNAHGTANQVLTTTGSGTLTFTTPTVSRPTTDQFTATAAQTSFTLAQTPLNAKVWMFINGVRTNNLAYTISGTTVTYTSANNNSYALVVGDRIQFDYAY